LNFVKNQNEIKTARSDLEILACYPIMAQLRPHLGPDEFLAQVRRQAADLGFQLVYLAKQGDVMAVAGIRIGEWLSGGKYLEIEDLVTSENARSTGHGGRLFDWIVEMSKAEGCSEVRLVSNVTRYGAHRFYLNKRMKIQAHYFSMDLSVAQA
jgi:GNAT superfamily N-acetyltransferase